MRRLICIAGMSAIAFSLAACSGNAPSADSDSNLVQPSTLTFCSELAFPPMESLEDGEPTGVDISIGDEIASRLSLSPTYLNIAFDGLIPALESGKCDAILSALAHTPERAEKVDFIDYLNWSGALIVPEGNPMNVTSEIDVCGLSAGSQIASTGLDNLEDINQRCLDAGKPAIVITTFKQDPQGVLALTTGKLDAYMTDAVPAANNLKNGAQYDIVLDSIAPVQLGIAITKTNDDLRSEIEGALEAMSEDGTMTELLDEYGLGAYQLEEK